MERNGDKFMTQRAWLPHSFFFTPVIPPYLSCTQVRAKQKQHNRGGKKKHCTKCLSNEEDQAYTFSHKFSCTKRMFTQQFKQATQEPKLHESKKAEDSYMPLHVNRCQEWRQHPSWNCWKILQFSSLELKSTQQQVKSSAMYHRNKNARMF